MHFATLCLLVFSGVVYGGRKEMENPNLYGGDMVLTKQQKARLIDGKFAYGSIRGRRWPNNIVPYVILNSIGTKGIQAINAAIADYHKYTCLKFQPRKGERGYVQFWRGGGCSSHVGYSGGKMDISLGQGCWDKGTVLHEVGHAIGLYHEQNRPDRDQYIKIHKNNVISGMYYNFQLEYNVDSLGTPYDLKSMMHYSSTSFATRRGLKTITTIDRSKQNLIDTNDWISGFSETDIKQINLMYKCDGTTGGTTGQCDNKESDCTYWAKNGYCTDAKQAQYMKDNCCKACKDGTTGGTTGQCDNKESDCTYWAKNGYCTDAKEAQYMKDNCCKACKEHGTCSNNNDQCDEWQKRGECNKNPNYMLVNCKKSCKQC